MDLTSITPDPTALKALAHPVRLRMLGLLRSDGPATASSLALRLGLNSGATSYHLRQLHQHGFVVDDPERGNGRDRWWRAAHQSTRAHPGSPSPDEREAADAFAQSVGIVHTEQLQRALEELPTLPLPWRRATTTSDWGMRLTPERARELMLAVTAVVDEWQEDAEDVEGAEAYVLQLHTFVRPGTLTPSPAVRS
ncbi:MAG TPA: helix-turn-helix domain-containing protein [Nocardioides sp.]|nr:helix-turn-helix domain-containing protein [Nocardioides sp.]